MGFTPERTDNAAFNPIPGLGAHSAALSEPRQPQERGSRRKHLQPHQCWTVMCDSANPPETWAPIYPEMTAKCDEFTALKKAL